MTKEDAREILQIAIDILILKGIETGALEDLMEEFFPGE